MTMITPSYLGETIEYSSLHACRSAHADQDMSLFCAGSRPRKSGSPARDKAPLDGIEIRHAGRPLSTTIV